MNEYLEMAPGELILGPNVRSDAGLTKEFVDSIRSNGVIVPIVAHRNADGQVVVDMGQRRRAGAIEAECPLVPVVVTDSPAEADAIVRGLTENDHRSGLGTSDRVKAFEQLALLGLSPTQIAKRTATKRKEVDAALKVAGSELASKAAERWDFLTLDQAAVLQEFEDDAEAVKTLVTAARGTGWSHAIQRLRDDREDLALLAARRTELAAEGVAVVEEMTYPMGRLSNYGIELDDHRGCDGHAAHVRISYKWDEGNDERTKYAETVWICVDVETNKHTTQGRLGSGAPEEKRPMTDEEKAERKVVLERNKQWRSAETVRREWLKTFLARKTAPAGSETFIALSLAMSEHHIKQAFEAQHGLMRELLGVAKSDKPQYIGAHEEIQQIKAMIEQASPKRATLLALGLLLCSWEIRTGTHTYRHQDETTKRYLGFMRSAGYGLSPVELVAIGEESTEEGEAA